MTDHPDRELEETQWVRPASKVDAGRGKLVADIPTHQGSASLRPRLESFA